MPIAQRRTARFERLPCVVDLVVYFSPAAEVVEAAAAAGSVSSVAVSKHVRITAYRALHA